MTEEIKLATPTVALRVNGGSAGNGRIIAYEKYAMASGPFPISLGGRAVAANKALQLQRSIKAWLTLTAKTSVTQTEQGPPEATIDTAKDPS